jgi:hypothetical protein
VSKSIVRRVSAPLGSLFCVLALAASLWPSSGSSVRTEDRNHDGRPDVWRVYDAHGVLRHVTIDTNFDGVPDREEQYETGVLVRRESDRNFDQLTDLVEDFDPITHLLVRSVTDVDYDGVADRLMLFQGGQAVRTEWAVPPSAPGGTGVRYARSATTLAPLADPFSQRAAYRSSHHETADELLLATVVAVVVDVPNDSSQAACSCALPSVADPLVSLRLDAASPRGPPLVLA